MAMLRPFLLLRGPILAILDIIFEQNWQIIGRQVFLLNVAHRIHKYRSSQKI
jgi:hypothetical protein